MPPSFHCRSPRRRLIGWLHELLTGFDFVETKITRRFYFQSIIDILVSPSGVLAILQCCSVYLSVHRKKNRGECSSPLEACRSAKVHCSNVAFSNGCPHCRNFLIRLRLRFRLARHWLKVAIVLSSWTFLAQALWLLRSMWLQVKHASHDIVNACILISSD